MLQQQLQKHSSVYELRNNLKLHTIGRQGIIIILGINAAMEHMC